MTQSVTKTAPREAVCDSKDLQSSKSTEVVYRPPMDLHEFEDRYELRLDAPGATTDDIAVTLQDSVLSVEVRVPDRWDDDAAPLLREYGMGDFRRRVRVGEDIDGDRLSAAYVDGVLTLTLPKRTERRPRRVPVTAG